MLVLLQNGDLLGRKWRGWTRCLYLIASTGFMYLSDELILTFYCYQYNLQPDTVVFLTKTATQILNTSKNLVWLGRISWDWTRKLSLISLLRFIYLSDELIMRRRGREKRIIRMKRQRSSAYLSDGGRGPGGSQALAHHAGGRRLIITRIRRRGRRKWRIGMVRRRSGAYPSGGGRGPDGSRVLAYHGGVRKASPSGRRARARPLRRR